MTTHSEQETASGKDNATKHLEASTTDSTSGKAARGRGRPKVGRSTAIVEDSSRVEAEAEVASAEEGGGTGKTAHLGLEIVPVATGSLYKIKNKAGGIPPQEFRGMFTGLAKLRKRVCLLYTSPSPRDRG